MWCVSESVSGASEQWYGVCVLCACMHNAGVPVSVNE